MRMSDAVPSQLLVDETNDAMITGSSMGEKPILVYYTRIDKDCKPSQP